MVIRLNIAPVKIGPLLQYLIHQIPVQIRNKSFVNGFIWICLTKRIAVFRFGFPLQNIFGKWVSRFLGEKLLDSIMAILNLGL
ncbi:MAG: hypothetical protein OXI05_00605, partial [Bacteroidota bacterium]|nr:hypothetical protein [Bacteroidota bacterium]